MSVVSSGCSFKSFSECRVEQLPNLRKPMFVSRQLHKSPKKKDLLPGPLYLPVCRPERPAIAGH